MVKKNKAPLEQAVHGQMNFYMTSSKSLFFPLARNKQ